MTRTVLFKDDDGNTVAAVEWDTDEWVTYCDCEEACDWRVRGSALDAVCAVTAAHVAAHPMVVRA